MRQLVTVFFCLGCFFYMPISMAFVLTSSAFENAGEIPVRYTCDGVNVAPDLHWDDVPVGTKSVALIVEDPDAPGGTWIHWVMFNLQGVQQWVAEDGAQKKGVQGYNSWHESGYRGPCPPHGEHRYFFR